MLHKDSICIDTPNPCSQWELPSAPPSPHQVSVEGIPSLWTLPANLLTGGILTTDAHQSTTKSVETTS